MRSLVSVEDRLFPDSAPLDHAPAAPSRIASRWPVYAEDEMKAVLDVLSSGRVNSLHHGEQCAALEAGFAALCRRRHAIALANGTLALEVALRALEIGPGDEVIVPARSFVATASCVVACGATPVFADIDPVSQGLSADTIVPHVTDRTRAVIVVHLGGYPSAMHEISALAQRHGMKVIEDCAQAHGATLDGVPVGAFSDAAAFSFCTDKIMSTGGEGGMLVLRDERVADRAWSLKDHGKDRHAAGAQSSGHTFRWLHDSFGSNYRLTEMQAAIGVAQLVKLPGWIETRKRNAALINAELAGCPAVRLIQPDHGIGHAYYKFYAFIREDRLQPSWTRDRIIEVAWRAGVPVQAGICPEIYREQAFVNAGIGPKSHFPVARRLGETSLMLPVDPTLDEASCRTMGRMLRTVLDEAGA
jgi:dTDP-4-amino-4,6-dideoxygalactose transaminase